MACTGCTSVARGSVRYRADRHAVDNLVTLRWCALLAY